jgi:hypothetical protein
MAVLFAPIDDEPIECRVSLWQGKSVHVFVHPRYRSRIGLFDGIPLIVNLAGRSFDVNVGWGGDFYASGAPAEIKPSYFDLDDHGEYEAEAWVDWDTALPDQVYEALRRDPGLADVWRSQTCATIRDWLNTIARARKPSSRMERELQLVGKLRALAADPR